MTRPDCFSYLPNFLSLKMHLDDEIFQNIDVYCRKMYENYAFDLSVETVRSQLAPTFLISVQLASSSQIMVVDQ